MAETNNEPKTWQEKLKAGVPLNSLDETKADADFNYKQRARSERERQAFEQRKSGQGLTAAPVAQAQQLNTEKKGE